MYHDTCKYIQFSPISKTNLCQIQNHVQICAVHMLLVLNWPPAVSLWFKYACKGPCAANMTCFCKKASLVSRLIAQLLWSISVTRFQCLENFLPNLLFTTPNFHQIVIFCMCKCLPLYIFICLGGMGLKAADFLNSCL